MACRWSAVDLKAGTIKVKQRADERGVIGSPKTTASRRTISIPSFLVTMLREWKIECTPGPLVFGNSRGNVQTLSDIHERAGVRYSEPSGSPRPMARPDSTFIACGTSGPPC